MEILRYLLIVVEVICCLLLIVVILLQQSKSQGMGLAFGGGMGETLFGSRAGNVLTKTTVILGLIFLANTTLLGILYTSHSEASLVESAPAPAPLPVSPAAPVEGGGLMSSAPQEAAPLLSSEPMTVELNPEPVVSVEETATPPVEPEQAVAPVEVTPVPVEQ